MISRRNCFARIAALAVFPILPVEAKEVWYYRGIEIAVDRSKRVAMTYTIDDWRRRDDIGSETKSPFGEEHLRRHIRKAIDYRFDGFADWTVP